MATSRCYYLHIRNGYCWSCCRLGCLSSTKVWMFSQWAPYLRYLRSTLTGHKEGSKQPLALRVRPTPTGSPQQHSLYPGTVGSFCDQFASRVRMYIFHGCRYTVLHKLFTSYTLTAFLMVLVCIINRMSSSLFSVSVCFWVFSHLFLQDCHFLLLTSNDNTERYTSHFRSFYSLDLNSHEEFS